MNEPIIKLTEWNRQTIGFAIKSLGEAVGSGTRENRNDDVIRNVKDAKRYVDEFLNGIYPAPELNDKEASLARALHTYSRKYMDNIFSCFVWQAINQGFGKKVWFTFIKACVENKFNVKEGYESAHLYEREDNGFENLAMLSILEQWIEFHDMQGTVKEIIKDGWLEE
jgi:hypothetical protein